MTYHNNLQRQSKKKNILFILFAIALFLQMLRSQNAWFLWDVTINASTNIALLTGVAYFYYSTEKRYLKTFMPAYMFFVLAILWNSNFSPLLLYLIQLPLLLVLLLTDREKQILLGWWTNLYAIILLVSLTAWLLTWFTSIPSYGELKFRESYTYTNYLFCIKSLINDIRFNAIFLEPGHTAMIAAFTVCANRFNFSNKAVVIILLCTIATFSLAGYLLLAIGYLLHILLENRKKMWKRGVIFAALLALGYYAAVTYNGGDNLVNTLILERLEYDEEIGISGNNRTGQKTDDAFDEIVDSGEALSGITHAKYTLYEKTDYIQGAGYKLYIMRKGIIGTALMFLFYFLVYRRSANKKEMFGMLIIYISAFWQRAYPEWQVWLYIYVFMTTTPIRYNAQKGLRPKPVSF